MPDTQVSNTLSHGRFTVSMKLAILLAVVSIAIYANTLRNGFAVDDFVVIQHNSLVTQGISGITELVSAPYHHGVSYLHENNLYRPLSMAFYATEYQLFGDSALHYHLLSILLFSLCVVLLFRFLQSIAGTGKTGVAFIATLIFAIHPIHTEVVANIKSQDELLCFLFAFLSLNVFGRYNQNRKLISLFVAAFCLLLSLLCKETSITFAAVVPLVFYFFQKVSKSRSLVITLSALVAVAIFIGIRAWVLSNYETDVAEVTFLDNQLINAPSNSSRFATAILIAGNYLKLLLVPYPLSFDYSFSAIPFAHFSDVNVIISIAAYLGLVIFGIVRLVKFRKDPYAFAILFYLVTLSVFLNIFFLIGSNMGERFLFFPSVGFCFILALLIEKVASKSADKFALLKDPRTWLVLGPVAIIFCWLTINRNADWHDNFTLYKSDSKKSSNSWKIYYCLGAEYCKDMLKYPADSVVQKPMIEEGIKNFQRAVAILPQYEIAQAQLATAFLALRNFDSAAKHFNDVLLINPQSKIAVQKLTGIYFYNGNYRKALSLFKYQLEVNHDGQAYGYMGVCYLKLARYDSAIVVFRNVLAGNPANASVNIGMAEAFTGIGNTDSARKYETIASQLTRK
jgi:protein O-mannosyl-transferase